MLGTRFLVFITQHSLLRTQHFHLMTLICPRRRTFGGIVTPIILAVLRLMMSSNLSTISTRRSRGPRAGHNFLNVLGLQVADFMEILTVAGEAAHDHGTLL